MTPEEIRQLTEDPGPIELLLKARESGRAFEEASINFGRAIARGELAAIERENRCSRTRSS